MELVTDFTAKQAHRRDRACVVPRDEIEAREALTEIRTFLMLFPCAALPPDIAPLIAQAADCARRIARRPRLPADMRDDLLDVAEQLEELTARVDWS